MRAMEPATTQESHPDWALVIKHGGPAKLAETLGWTKEGSVQRVQNWRTRGIPSHVKLERPDLFLPGLRPVRGKSAKPSTEKTEA